MALTKVSRGLLSTGIVDNSNATAITIDSFENVGIGNLSPSSYFSNASNLVVGGATGANGMTISGSTDTQIFFADGTSGADAYRGIIRYSHADNGFSFWTNATRRLDLDSSGNLFVGGSTYEGSTTSNASSAYIASSGFISANVTDDFGMQVNRTGTNGTLFNFRKNGADVGHIGTTGGKLYIGSQDGSDAFLRFESNEISPCAHEGSFRDAAISLGKSASRFKDLYLSGTASMGGLSPGIVTISSGSYFIGNAANGYRFNNAANTSNLMILKDNGDLSVGTTGSGHRLFLVNAVNATQSNAQLRISGSGYSAFHFLDANAYHIGQNSQGRYLRMYSGGNTGIGVSLSPQSTSWGTYSDERLKSNIEPIESAIESLLGLRTVKYHLKDVDSAESKKRLGLIAQDLIGVLDEVIEPTTQAKDDTKYLSVRYTEIIPVLVKAIQEQQATIEALTQRIQTLENN